ncbi:MAG: sigma 54-interacting transcriptional regulator [Acidobacteria bacterium]|nr:sigma 54-interacting transcriptional regulator [Acidobacteriota bacterium]
MSELAPHDRVGGAEAKFRQFLESAPDALVIVNQAGVIEVVNAQAERLFGYSREEMLGCTIEMLVPSRFRTGHLAHRDAYVGAAKPRPMGAGLELYGLRKDGTEIFVDISLSPLRTEDGLLVISAIRDISDRKKVEADALAAHIRARETLEREAADLQRLVERRTAQLRSAEDRHRVVLDVNNAVISILGRDPLFDAIFQALGRVLRFDRASVTLADFTRGVSTLQALAGGSEHPPLLTGLPVGTEIPHQGTRIGRVLAERRPLVARDFSREPAVGPEKQLLELGIRSGIAAPLLGRRGAIGVVNVGSLEPNQYTEDDAEFLTEIGKQLAVAIENMRAFEEIARLKARLEQENLYLQEEVGIPHGIPDIVGTSAAIRKVVQAVETVAPTDATVLITGETGTGKELIARAIHSLSRRRGSRMVKVNCAALPAGLIESELFGHEKGAFTGAAARRLGRFELADHGTILLDEIGALPVELQAKQLRVLQEAEFERVGGTTPVKVDVRVVASTNRDLEEAIREGGFRSDLYYRLSVFPISAPPLRDRKEDIPLLVRHLVMKCCSKFGKRIETIPQAVMASLESYPWPGNVRELENVVERAVIVTRGPRLDLGDWLPRTPASHATPAALTLQDVERQHIRDVLESTGWQVSGERGAARILGLKSTTLEARMKKLGIRRPV